MSVRGAGGGTALAWLVARPRPEGPCRLTILPGRADTSSLQLVDYATVTVLEAQVDGTTGNVLWTTTHQARELAPHRRIVASPGSCRSDCRAAAARSPGAARRRHQLRGAGVQVAPREAGGAPPKRAPREEARCAASAGRPTLRRRVHRRRRRLAGQVRPRLGRCRTCRIPRCARAAARPLRTARGAGTCGGWRERWRRSFTETRAPEHRAGSTRAGVPSRDGFDRAPEHACVRRGGICGLAFRPVAATLILGTRQVAHAVSPAPQRGRAGLASDARDQRALGRQRRCGRRRRRRRRTAAHRRQR